MIFLRWLLYITVLRTLLGADAGPNKVIEIKTDTLGNLPVLHRDEGIVLFYIPKLLYRLWFLCQTENHAAAYLQTVFSIYVCCNFVLYEEMNFLSFKINKSRYGAVWSGSWPNGWSTHSIWNCLKSTMQWQFEYGIQVQWVLLFSWNLDNSYAINQYY